MLTVMIVDDEPLAHDVLLHHLAERKEIKVVKQCYQAVEALAWLANNRVDVLLLDINMPQLSGMEMLRVMAKPPQIIIISAYQEYALEGFELNVTDYSSLLQGEVEFRVFIDTWGTGGWQLTLNLEYTEGVPDYPYSGVVEAWDGSYSFGDPSNLQPVETFNTDLLAEVQSSHLRLSNTGHGWGNNNSNNASLGSNSFEQNSSGISFNDVLPV